jgi:hypothetical protein
VTVGQQPLGVGEERTFDLDYLNSKLSAEAEGEDDLSRLTGTVGLSLCPAGNGSAPCPFYLGHLNMTAVSALEVEIECPDESPTTLTLDNLVIRLSQPAFGISATGTDEVAFPPGALIFEGEFDVGATHYELRGPNTEVVFVTADEDTFYATDIPVEGWAPCGSGTTLAAGTFRVVADVSGGPNDGPPTITITTSSTVSCPSNVPLTATTGDPDSDLDTVRWYVDDVLMVAGTTSMWTTTGHVLRAVARDDRGATTTATKTIACAP